MDDRSIQTNRILDFYLGHFATHLIRLGVDTGLFARLAENKEGIEASALSSELDLNTEYIEHFLQAAYSLHLLDLDIPTGKYRFSPHMDVILGKPENFRYLGNLAYLYIVSARDFEYLPELLKTGGRNPYQDHDKEFFDAVAHATEVLAQFVAKAVVPRIPSLKERDDVKALDIGCGEGSALIALAKAFPKGRVIGIDIESYSIEKANIRIRSNGLEDRVEARVAAAEELDEREKFDLVTLIQVLHETKKEVRDTILARAYSALRSGGSLVVIDEPYPESISSLRDAPGAVLTQFTEIFWGNVLISPEEQKQLLVKAGFEVLSQTVPDPGLICITVANRV
jgi:ubiquinone/menaquinone biosynthesis C-methylase UbiE